MKFMMEEDALRVLGQKTTGAGDDLAALVRQFAQAAEPLQGKFAGSGKAAFDQFKAEADDIAVELNRALNAVLQGISGQETAFGQGMDDITTTQHQANTAADIDAARFSGAGV